MNKRITYGLVVAAIFLCGMLYCCAEQKAEFSLHEDDGVTTVGAIIESIYDITQKAGISDSTMSLETETEWYTVYVCGEVMSPGVYKVKAGSRLYEAIELAGGMTGNAADGYLNLADVAADGQKIMVPPADQVTVYYSEQHNTGGMAKGLIDINRADETLLTSLPGIGEAKAKAIIAYREKNGRFSSKEEIMNVSGIKSAAYEQIKELIIVE